MKLHYNAVTPLYNKVKSIGWEDSGSWRCIHANMTGGRQFLHPYSVSKLFAGLLAEDEGYIYAFDDGDIFILFQGASRPIIKKISKHFDKREFRQCWEPPRPALFTLYDLAVYWKPLYTLCQHKLHQLHSVFAESYMPLGNHGGGVLGNQEVSVSG